jgi:hypothetical protein
MTRSPQRQTEIEARRARRAVAVEKLTAPFQAVRPKPLARRLEQIACELERLRSEPPLVGEPSDSHAIATLERAHQTISDVLSRFNEY